MAAAQVVPSVAPPAVGRRLRPQTSAVASTPSGAGAEAAPFWWRAGLASSATAFTAAVFTARQRRRRPFQGRTSRHANEGMQAVVAPGAGVKVVPGQQVDVPEELEDIAVAGRDTKTPHWSNAPMKQEQRGLKLEQLDWPNLHGIACGASGVLFLLELVRFIAGQPPSDAECYVAAVIYAAIYASRFSGIRGLAPHFRVTFYATTGWTVYYIAHLLAATSPELFAHSVYPTGIVFLASTIYFYKHWLERMYRHYVEDRFRPYYLPGLLGLMYFHGLDIVDMFNQWFDPNYWVHVPMTLPDQAWTIQDVRLTGLFMSSMALFMITLHNKGVLTGGQNTLITVLFTIFVPAFFLTGTHATLQASFP